MQSLYFRPFTVLSGIVLAMLLLAGCGATSLSVSSVKTPTTTTPPGTKPFASTNINSAADGDISGFHIHTDGIGCNAVPILKSEPQGQLDTGTVQAMSNYIESYYDHKPLPSIPPNMQVSAGAPQCLGAFEFTNTSQQVAQVMAFGVTLEQTPVQNTTVYRLVDACTFGLINTLACCAFCGAGPGPCTSLSADITLTAERDGAHQEQPLQSGSGCPSLQVTPSATVSVQVTFDLRTSPIAHPIYGVHLTTTIAVAGQPKVITLPTSFDSVLVSDSNKQQCFGLQGNTLVDDSKINAQPKSCV